MARQAKRGFWVHFCVNAVDESMTCCKNCEESFSRYIEGSESAYFTYSSIGISSIGKIWYQWNTNACMACHISIIKFTHAYSVVVSQLVRICLISIPPPSFLSLAVYME